MSLFSGITRAISGAVRGVTSVVRQAAPILQTVAPALGPMGIGLSAGLSLLNRTSMSSEMTPDEGSTGYMRDPGLTLPMMYQNPIQTQGGYLTSNLPGLPSYGGPESSDVESRLVSTWYDPATGDLYEQ